MNHLVLELVIPYLSIGDVFRLRRALGRFTTWHEETVVKLLLQCNPSFVASLSQTALQGTYFLSDVSRSMSASFRCSECGITSRRRIQVCKPCALDPRSFVSLMTRANIQDLAPLQYRKILEVVIPATRVGNGALLYWKRDVERVLRKLTVPRINYLS